MSFGQCSSSPNDIYSKFFAFSNFLLQGGIFWAAQVYVIALFLYSLLHCNGNGLLLQIIFKMFFVQKKPIQLSPQKIYDLAD